MKIALLTIWHVGNYGAELQTYATCRMLNDLGHEVTVIDFRENEADNPSLKNKLAMLVSRLTPAHRKFSRFWRKHIPDKTKHYRFYTTLKKAPPKADMYLVGSDQVWNPTITRERADAYFLNFGTPKIKKASYASSFGTSNWIGSEQLKEIARKNLADYMGVSCREASGVKILNEMFGIQACQVLDPTLLFSNYEQLTGPVRQRKTLVYYPLSTNEELERFAKKLANEINLTYLNANKKTMLTNSIAWNRPGVEDWVRSIAEASFVVTPSFHGLAFCLIYHKPFVVVNNVCKTRSCRLLELLEAVGLEDRFFYSISDAEKAKIWESPIDYTKVDARLKDLRQSSLNFLQRILQ